MITNQNNKELRWVSIGNPKLVLMKDTHIREMHLCLFTDEYFSFAFEMLNSDLQIKLKEYVKEKRTIDVSANSFLDLKANSITCMIELYDVESKKNIVMKGYIIFIEIKFITVNLGFTLLIRVASNVNFCFKFHFRKIEKSMSLLKILKNREKNTYSRNPFIGKPFFILNFFYQICS